MSTGPAGIDFTIPAELQELLGRIDAFIEEDVL
ncbi:MAG: hypothetical protein JWP18_62, partial [Solirubrobacterales bacterium]|nr:hypothetical protein [Solirubrobacterales bacterium]